MKIKFNLLNLIINKNYINQRLDKAIYLIIKKYSRNKIIKLIKNKQVYINNTIVKKPNTKTKENDNIIIKIYKKKKNIKFKIKLNIVYEDNYILIINKKSGLVVHPGIGNENNTLMNSLIYNYPKINNNIPRYGIIHRLDKNTTGLIIIAKNINTYNILIEKMKKRKIIRIYKTIVWGEIKYNGLINKPISRNKKKRTIMSINTDGKQAITTFKVIENFKYFTFLNVKLYTGRTHQIRVHMKYINHPIIGDKVYKNNIFYKKKINKNINKLIKKLNRQALHASTLIFLHPIQKNIIKINTPLPNDMLNILHELRINN